MDEFSVTQGGDTASRPRIAGTMRAADMRTEPSAMERSRDSPDGLGSHALGRPPAETEAKAYWWRDTPPFGAGRGIQNFGDRLTPLLLERFAGVRTQWAPPEKANGPYASGQAPCRPAPALRSGLLLTQATESMGFDFLRKADGPAGTCAGIWKCGRMDTAMPRVRYRWWLQQRTRTASSIGEMC
jgi:hypothetical protein